MTKVSRILKSLSSTNFGLRSGMHVATILESAVEHPTTGIESRNVPGRQKVRASAKALKVSHLGVPLPAGEATDLPCAPGNGCAASARAKHRWSIGPVNLCIGLIPALCGLKVIDRFAVLVDGLTVQKILCNHVMSYFAVFAIFSHFGHVT